MRIPEATRAGLAAVLFATAFAGATVAAHALDEKSVRNAPERSPWAVFKFGYSAYQKGDKDQAVEAYRYAAENGQLGARWKLARMYAQGDGVKRNHYEAFKFFSEIAQQEVESGSPDESYVSDALVALGGYFLVGIPDSPVRANPQAAQEYFMRAAATYRNPVAQYQIGKMFLEGIGSKPNIRQAGRWLQLAAEKGHAGAQATLGDLLFQRGQVVRGLAMMTAALERAQSADEAAWIRNMQEDAFALAPEPDRRTAISLAADMLAHGVK